MMPTRYNAEIYTKNETLTLRGVPHSEIRRVVNETLATGEQMEIAVRPAPPALEDYLTYGWPVWCVSLPSGREHTFVHEKQAKHFAKHNEGTKPIKVLRLGNTFRKMTAWGGCTHWDIADFRSAYPHTLPPQGVSEEEE
jgi:hypothetical protein